jgi:sulfotransferase
MIAGLPRSGSTLLTNILAQNKQFQPTSTSGVLDLLNMVRNNWSDIDSMKAAGLEKTIPAMRSFLRDGLNGFYDEDSIVFDKNRGWINNIEFIEEVLGRPVKIIVCIRDVKDIVASFEKLNNKQPLLRNSLYSNEVARLSIYSRSVDLLSTTGVIGSTVNMLRDAFQKGYSDRLVLVPMEQLTKNPENTMGEIHKVLGLEHFNYDFDNVEQLINEDDTVYGIPGLHDIKNKVEYFESTAIEVLGEQICNEIDEAYADIKNLLGE